MSVFGPESAALVVAAAIAATAFWRGLGVFLAQRLDTKGAVFRWFSFASFAVLAGLLARLLILPSGELATVGLEVRLGAAVIGVAAFYLSRRNLLIGVASGTLSFALAAGALG
ncbi:MAG: AzlD domain-containing protein [Thalassobaculaceae bacterium]|nr:AzlD domain-containing protein [Thalassobaculaceae bacterium]